ncbi:Prolyl 4-hydroxylase subunit alpha-2 [Blattella germanica]|nr:Prolyl 4-hydroxylase subunit alpha-2 [Blattella germanica]
MAIIPTLVLWLAWSGLVRGELYTCLADMEELMETEALLMRHAAEYAKEHEEASQDIQGYLSNPINAYLLVKRLTTDWKEVETQMVDDVGKAGDCFELGRQSYNNGDYYHTVLWMTEALQRHEEEYNKTTDKSDILEYLAFSTYKQGNVHRALQLTNELLSIIPTHQRALGNKVVTINDQRQPLAERDVYEMHCRLEHQMPASISSKLKCRYTDKGNPYLRLARVKEEEAYLKPLILIYHDVIYDSEIETIKKLSLPRFKRATVQNSKTGELETANYRISKSAWLKDEYHHHVAAVNRRVQDITGLTVSTAEELQVVNYGIGGHYEPHFDFARKEEGHAFKSLGTGNRIATFLFYFPTSGSTKSDKNSDVPVNSHTTRIDQSRVTW